MAYQQYLEQNIYEHPLSTRAKLHPMATHLGLPKRAFSYRTLWYIDTGIQFLLCMHFTLDDGQHQLAIIFFCIGCIHLHIHLFLQLRFLDEFKDHEVDKKYRPERAVPRGLVTLKQIRSALIISIIIQSGLVFWLNPKLLLILFAVWVYMALMTVEFFAADWLKPRLLIYMWSHMLIMPIIDLFATGADWMLFNWLPPAGLFVFLMVSFFNGLIVELGRKIWAPSQERTGVDSYSSHCGLSKALRLFQTMLVMAYVCVLTVGYQVNFFIPVALLMTFLLLIGLKITTQFSCLPEKARMDKKLENFSGIWVVLSYLILGIIPLGYAIWTL